MLTFWPGGPDGPGGQFTLKIKFKITILTFNRSQFEICTIIMLLILARFESSLMVNLVSKID